ncbi:UNVERIFIED_CONTAM: hypothetical protein GTU68_028379 [Idotea baltica]|nr:hypothetical protein [Idotea baltica]
MGVGKSTLGKLVARDLDLPFLDFDHIIEDAMEMSISNIFARYGEAFFRKLEHDHLRDLIAISNSFVVGTGGGLPCNSENMATMNQAGLTVYLSASPEDIASRLSHSTASRPLIAGKNMQELEEYVAVLLSKRRIHYEQSHIRVELDLGRSKQFNAGQIVQAVRANIDLLDSRV